jgi:hypothetical protein
VTQAAPWGLDDYVTDIDAHAENNTPVFRIGHSKFSDARLELHSSPNRFHCARKLCQEPVAGILDDATAVFRDRGRDTIREKRSQFGVCGLLVMVHEPRIARHVSGHYRSQPTLNPDWPLLHHGMQPNLGSLYGRSDGQCQTLRSHHAVP